MVTHFQHRQRRRAGASVIDKCTAAYMMAAVASSGIAHALTLSSSSIKQPFTTDPISLMAVLTLHASAMLLQDGAGECQCQPVSCATATGQMVTPCSQYAAQALDAPCACMCVSPCQRRKNAITSRAAAAPVFQAPCTVEG